MPGVKTCDSYDCANMPKTGTGCLADIDIRGGVCINYSKANFSYLKAQIVKRNKRGALVGDQRNFLK